MCGVQMKGIKLTTLTTNVIIFRNNTALSISHCSMLVGRCLPAAAKRLCLSNINLSIFIPLLTEFIDFINRKGTTSTEIQTCSSFSKELWPQQQHMIRTVHIANTYTIKSNSKGQVGRFTKCFVHRLGILSTLVRSISVSWTLLTVKCN